MEKKRYWVRDTIPETPASFRETVEDSLQAVCGQKQQARRSFSGPRLKKKWLLPLVAAAVLLVSGTALAAGLWLRDNYSPSSYMQETKEEREQKEKTIPDVEKAIESAEPKTGDYTIVMLPEFENAEEMDNWRVKMGQPKYNEADWSWVRDIQPEIAEVLIDGRTLNFNIRLNTDHAQAFRWPDVEGQWVEALVDNLSFRKEGDSMSFPLFISGSGINPNMVTETGATLYGEVILDQQKVDFPTVGRVELTVEIGLRDARVDDMASIGILGRLYYTFSFDAAAAKEAAPAQITERKLSGGAVLTVDDWSDPDKPRMYNQRVSLDEVALKEEIRYRQTGIYVTYTVQTSPADWTEAMKNSLLYPNREGTWHGLYIQYRIGQEGEWLPCGHENHGNFGENVVILPIFPSEYEKAKQEGVYLRLTECYGTALNGEPIGEDWKMVLGEGAMSLNFTVEGQEIGVFQLPMP